MTRHSARRPDNGFTLVEMLVAMSLLAVLMVALASVMRSMAQTETKVDQRLQRIDDMRVTRGFLQQVMGRVSARPLPPAAGAGTVLPFRATADRVEWVGIMPARHGMGGRHFFRLALEDSDRGPALVLRFQPWEAGLREFPDWSAATPRVLVAGVTHFAVQAQGRPEGARPMPPTWSPGWAPGWTVSELLPERVLLSLADAQGPWPDLILPVQELSQGRAAGGVFSIGGSR